MRDLRCRRNPSRRIRNVRHIQRQAVSAQHATRREHASYESIRTISDEDTSPIVFFQGMQLVVRTLAEGTHSVLTEVMK